MIERVARMLALASLKRAAKRRDECGGQSAWVLERKIETDRHIDQSWTDHVDEARAAIEAMREPTEAMKTCSEDVHWGYSCHTCGGLTNGWYAMIDSALKE